MVRNRFKQAQYVQSTRRLKIAFEAGYEAIDQLDAAAAGDNESKSYIVSLIERAPARVKQPKAITFEGRRQHENKNDANVEPHARSSLVERFERAIPLAQLSGRRHVPTLVNANHIPILRIRKPQSETLSRYIRQRIQQRQKRHDRRHMLGGLLELAKSEDRWDSICVSNLENGKEVVYGVDIDGREPRWSAELEQSLREVQTAINEEGVKNMLMARKMQDVVDRETELYEKEKEEKMRAKKRANRLKRNERRRLEKAAVEANAQSDPEQKAVSSAS